MRRVQRFNVRGVSYICKRLAQETSATLDETERFRLWAHQLCHTFSAFRRFGRRQVKLQ